MRFTDKVTEAIHDHLEVIGTDIRSDLRTTTKEVSALVGLGMIAFTLISLVAVTALLKASK